VAKAYDQAMEELALLGFSREERLPE